MYCRRLHLLWGALLALSIVTVSVQARADAADVKAAVEKLTADVAAGKKVFVEALHFTLLADRPLLLAGAAFYPKSLQCNRIKRQFERTSSRGGRSERQS